MNGADRVSIVVVLLGFLTVKVLGRNSTTTAISKGYCSKATDAPAQVLEVIPSTEVNGESFRTISAALAARRRKKSGYKEEPMDCSNRNMLVQGSITESGRLISGKSFLEKTIMHLPYAYLV